MKLRVLVLGADTFQIGILRYLNEMGYETHVITNRPDNPAVAYANYCHEISYTDIDVVWQVFKTINAVQIFSVASDASILCQATIQNRQGIYGCLPEFIEFFTDKSLYKNKLQQSLPKNIPNVTVCETKQELIQFYKANQENGIIVKPCKGSGSKNVTYLNSLKEVHAFNWEGHSKDFLTESFIKGQEFGGDFICHKGELIFYHPTLKKTNKFYVPTSHLVLKNNADLPGLKEFIQEIISCLNLQDSIFNIDIILNNNQWYLLDISPRIGGNCIPDIIELSTGVNEWEFTTSLLINKQANALHKKWNKPHGVYIIGSEKTGNIQNRITANYPSDFSIHEIYWKVNDGDLVDSFTEGSKHLGYVIYEANSDQELIELSNKIESYEWFTLR